MKMRIIGSTKPDHVLPLDEALLFSGHSAGICYMPDSFDALVAEPREKTEGRVRGTVGSGHHSVSGHVSYNILLEGVPKIVAMILNNEHEYNTSEKSARYTVMQTTDDEQVIYDKWTEKLQRIILAKYPNMKAAVARKLALENARYFISVFTPATTMEYTVSLRQANYLLGFCRDFVKMETSDLFFTMLKPCLCELADLLAELEVPGLTDNKGRGFSLFAKRVRKEYFGETYCANYTGTFSEVAQAMRHRTLWHEIIVPDPDCAKFYIPEILEDEEDIAEWIADMRLLKYNYPQGMLLQVNERGTAEMFVLKLHERLCGAAQLEICKQSFETLMKYYNATRLEYPEIHDELDLYIGKTKCQFGYYKCERPCPLGPKHALVRRI